MECYVVHVTKKCNMRCLYCYEQDKDSEYTWEEVRAVVDNLINYSPTRNFRIEFLGGEPLMAFDIIEKVVEYTEGIPNLDIAGYTITTNGTILNKEIIYFLTKYPKVSWHASMDGNVFMNQLRIMKETSKNSHDIVLKNHKMLEKVINIDRLGVHMVTHPFNVGSLYDGVKHLYEHGVRSIGIGTIEGTMIIGAEYCKKFLSEMDLISKGICDGELKDLNIDILNWVKPKEDTRYYIKDNTGKIIAESYGRDDNDITQSGVYNSVAVSSNLGDLIYNIRHSSYMNHQKRLASQHAIKHN